MPITSQVAIDGRSPRKSHDSPAENIVLEARMKTRLAVDVLNTAMVKQIEPRP